MLTYTSIRLIRSAATLAFVLVSVFFMVRLAGDPMLALAGPDPDPAYVEELRQRWGLDQPLWAQFQSYVVNALQGDFGRSYATGEPAMKLFLDRVPATIELGVVSLLLSLAIGLPMGIVAALNFGSVLDRVVMSTAVLAFSLPNFFLGILFILLFSLHLRWLPSFGSGSWQHMVMPVLTLALSSAGAIARFARSSMLDVLNQPYLSAARARGIPGLHRITGHALPNASIPLVTVIGLRVGDLIAGAIVVETVFAWPGVGRLLAEAVEGRDLAVVQVVVVATAATMIVSNLLVDLTYGWLDPRVKDE